MTEPRERDMVGGNPITLFRSFGKSLFAGSDSGLGVHVIIDRHRGVRELDGGGVDNVTPENQFLAFAANQVKRMSGGVAGSCQRQDAGDSTVVGMKFNDNNFYTSPGWVFESSLARSRGTVPSESAVTWISPTCSR